MLQNQTSYSGSIIKTNAQKSYNTANKVSPVSWIQHIENLYSPPVFDLPALDHIVATGKYSLNSPITTGEITQQMKKKIKDKKACGLDGLGGRILKCCLHSNFIFSSDVIQLFYFQLSFVSPSMDKLDCIHAKMKKYFLISNSVSEPIILQ